MITDFLLVIDSSSGHYLPLFPEPVFGNVHLPQSSAVPNKITVFWCCDDRSGLEIWTVNGHHKAAL